MEVASLDAKIREEFGRSQVRHLRTAGMIPAVIYGMGGENRNLTLPGKEFVHHVLHHHKLFELHLPDGSKEEAFLQDLQWDNLTDRILHADFLRIDLEKPMHTEVEIIFAGIAKGTSKGGIFESALAHLSIECLPSALPESIRVVINELDIGGSIHVGDLELPAGVEALTDSRELVCQVKARYEAPEPEEGEGEEEAPAEPEVIGKEPKPGGEES